MGPVLIRAHRAGRVARFACVGLTLIAAGGCSRGWFEMGQTPAPFDLSEVQSYLDFARSADPAATAELRVDNLNLAP